MPNMFRRGALFLALLSSALHATAQLVPTLECPTLGPTFSSDFDLASTAAIREAKSNFPRVIDALFDAGAVNKTHTSFAIDVFSTYTNRSIYSYHYAAPALNGTLTTGALDDGTLFRIGSVSKLYTVYAIIAKAGLGIFDHPITKYLPELAGNAGGSPLEKIIWEEVTVGALAAQQGGTGGFPVEFSGCNPPQNCSAQDFLTFMRDRQYPTAPVFDTPLYSDSGFGVLGRVLERITGLPYNDAIKSVIGAPLGLKDTASIEPKSEGRNALILPGGFNVSSWGFDNQVSAPSGGIYSSNADLRLTGLSILHSALLPPPVTRAWLKPRAHTASLALSIGAPWEINRLTIPVSPNSNRTRVSDLYTKLGGQVGYTAVFALSPDHGLGYSVLLAGPRSGADRFPLRNAVGTAFVAAAEHAAAENAARNFAGTFVDEHEPGSNITLSVGPDKPGLGVDALFWRGDEVRDDLAAPGKTLPPANITVRAYPTGLEAGAGYGAANATAAGSRLVKYRVIAEALPKKPRVASEGGEGLFGGGCETFFNVGYFAIEGKEIDELVFEVAGGRLESVRSPALGTNMRRVR